MIDYNNSDIINCLIGQNVKIIKPVNMYGCTIGDDSFVGPFCEIQKNVVIGNNVKVVPASNVTNINNFPLSKAVEK